MRVPGIVVPLVWLLLAISSPAQVAPYWLHAKPNPVEVRFVKSPYADYLFYLLYRNTGNFDDLAAAVPLGDVPQLEALISLPEQVASAQVTSYAQVYEMATEYRDTRTRIKVERVKPPGRGWETRYKILTYSNELPQYENLKKILIEGEAGFPAFEKYWYEKIAPEEDRQIVAWQQQLAECRPFDKLQYLLRIQFPFEKVDVAAIALHLSGSGDTDPAGVYTSLFKKPKLGWVIGHEGTHLAIDENAGANWRSNPLAARAIELMKQRGGTASDIEEALPLLMQVKLSQACGETEPAYDFASRLDNSAKRDIVLELDRRWPGYQRNYEENAIQFLLTSAIKAMQPATTSEAAKTPAP